MIPISYLHIHCPINRGQYREVQIQQFVKTLDRSINHEIYAKCFKIEKYFTLKEFQKMNNGKPALNGESDAMHTLGEIGDILYRSFLLDKDKNAYLKYINQVEDIAKHSYYQREEERKAIVEDLENPGIRFLGPSFLHNKLDIKIPKHPTTNIIIPVFCKTDAAQARHEVNLAQSKTALALMRYRRDNGSYPSTLSLLVPRYISEVPIDVFDGQPMRYRLEGSGYILYSVSVNLEDDNGVHNDAWRNGDWVWRVEH